MGIMDKIGSNLGSAINSAVNNSVLQGAMGNMSEVTPEKLTQDYGMYLMDGEVIKMGFILLRDVVIFTDRRILDFDKQGTTGQKARVSSIYLDSVINVSAETAGFGFDDSEINIDYIVTPYYRCSCNFNGYRIYRARSQRSHRCAYYRSSCSYQCNSRCYSGKQG